MTSVSIKVEPSSPPTMPPAGTVGVDIKVEPSSPPATPPPGMMGVDIKVEPSSPPATPPPDATKSCFVDMDRNGPSEAAALLPTIVSVSTSTNSAETSEGAAVLDGNIRTCEEATESQLTTPGTRVANRNVCDVCGQCFTTKGSLNRHRNLHTGEKAHICSVCGHKFATRSNLATHVRVHTGEKPFACSICGRKFADKTALNRHHRYVHVAERPYTCAVCGLKFPDKSVLVRHERLHTGEKPYACEMCPSKFFRKDDLGRHMQLHESGVDMCNCMECGKAFKSEKSMLQHIKWHRAEKPYACHLCPARFAEEKLLEYHMSMHRSEYIIGIPYVNAQEYHMSTQKSAVGSTDSTMEIMMPSNSSTFLPAEDVKTNQTSLTDESLDSSSIESSRGITDSYLTEAHSNTIDRNVCIRQ